MTSPNPQQALEILADLGAIEVLANHQRRDSASCTCGWNEWGRSHALHVWRELKQGVLPTYARQIRAETLLMAADKIKEDDELWGYEVRALLAELAIDANPEGGS